MKKKLIYNKEYFDWFNNLKSLIKQSQIKASLSVNTHLIIMYWNLGREIVNKQKKTKWGSGFIKQLSQDLKRSFTDNNGFSESNLRLIQRFYKFYSKESAIREQVVPELQGINNSNYEQVVLEIDKGNQEYGIFFVPWGHHVLLLKKVKNDKEAIFYVNETIANNWSRSVLEYQIETDLYSRQGKAVSNFKNTLPEADSDLAQQMLKDPYKFEFLELAQKIKEKDLENKLIENLTQFLLELGKGFAYLGRQYLLKVGEKEYRLDLLFYHTKLKRYIVIELKTVEFEPEFIGKLNFYLSAVDDMLKDNNDSSSIGILLCRSKDKLNVEYALKDIGKPIGVSDYIYKELPENIKKELPSAKELENELLKEIDE